jgi:hypothetical protein
MKLRERVVHFVYSKVPAQTEFGTLGRLKRDKSAAKLHTANGVQLMATTLLYRTYSKLSVRQARFGEHIRLL